MGKPAYSLRIKLISLCTAALLTCGFLPMLALADDSQDDSVAASFVLADSKGSGEAATPSSAASGNGAEGAILASSLAPNGASIVSADVALDVAEPIVGSFTVDGLTYALNDGGVTLISVAGPLGGPERGGFAEGEFAKISIPASVTYSGVTYPVTAIGPYAFYLSGATDVSLSASIASVDDRAFRSSDVERVEVVSDNPDLASFDGVLYSADLSRLLLIPEGRKGSVLLSCETEVVQASLFSHCSLVEAISVEEGGAAFSSWDGLLYTSDGATLLRVPAGTTDITVRDGCTIIATGAMEGCAKLERINAPGTVTSISPDVFEFVPTVSLPIASVLQDGSQDESVAGPLAGPGYEGDARSASADSNMTEGETKGSASAAPQLTAMVALSSADDNLPDANPSSILLLLPANSDLSLWESVGFTDIEEESAPLVVQLQSANSYSANIALYTSIACRALYSAYYAGVLQDQRYVSVPANSYFINSAGFSGISVTPSYYVQCTKSSGATLEQYDYSNFTSETLGTYVYVLPSGGNGSFYWDAAQTAWVNPGTYASGGTLYLGWRYTSYSISYNSNGGSYCAAVSGNATQSIVLPTPAHAGYTFRGWAVGDAIYEGNVQVGIGTLAAKAGCHANKVSDTVILTAQWAANTISLSWDSQGGNASESTTQQLYSPTAKVVLPAGPTRTGYTFAGWWTAPSGGVQVTSATTLPTANSTYYAHWDRDTYSISYELNGGTVSGNPSAYTVESATFTLKNPMRAGYVFSGWSGTGLAGNTNTLVQINAGSTGNRSYEAHWISSISAEVPLEATARIDKLGIEEQTEGSAYIKSLCGEPLKVTDADFEPLPGAATLFGTDIASVSLEAFADAATTPFLRFALDSAGTESDSTLLAPLTMASYGTRIPISYRFDIPDALLFALAETTLPVCQVSYTVALA